MADARRRQRARAAVSQPRQGRRYAVHLATRGGNRSWNGTVKRFDARRADFVFVLVGDGRRWFIPAEAVGGGSGILLGGPKYAEFEIDRGVALAPAGQTAPGRGPS